MKEDLKGTSMYSGGKYLNCDRVSVIQILKGVMMEQDGLEKQMYLSILFLIFTLTFLFITGCEENPLFTDPNMDALEKWSRRPWLTPDADERFSLAISTYKNNTMDPVPILLVAFLSKPIGSEEVNLGVVVLDEDKDMQGFVIKEESQDPNGTANILTEDYPAFVHHPCIIGVNSYIFPISIRKNGQLKNNKLWTEYLTMDFDAQVKQIKVPKSGDWFAEVGEYWDRVYKLWNESLPTIYTSIPDPNELNIWMHVYDKAGNKSNSIKLSDQTKQND